MTDDKAAYRRQGFGKNLDLDAPFGLLIIDFVNGFLDPIAQGTYPRNSDQLLLLF